MKTQPFKSSGGKRHLSWCTVALWPDPRAVVRAMLYNKCNVTMALLLPFPDSGCKIPGFYPSHFMGLKVS